MLESPTEDRFYKLESSDKSEIRVRFWQTTRNPVRSQKIPDFRTNFYSHSQIPRKSQELLSLAQICQTLPKFTANPETLPINGLHPEKHLRSHVTTMRRPEFATMLRTQPRSATLTIHVPRFRAFTGTHTQDHLVSKVKPRLPGRRCRHYASQILSRPLIQAAPRPKWGECRCVHPLFVLPCIEEPGDFGMKFSLGSTVGAEVAI